MNSEGDDFLEKTSDQGDRRYLFYLQQKLIQVNYRVCDEK